MYTDVIVFWDVHHREVILGEANAYQHQVSQDELGNVVAPATGGKFGKESDITSMKYPGEGRGCVVVAIVCRDGKKERVRVKPFN